MRLDKIILASFLIILGFLGFAQEELEELDPMLINFKAKVISAADSTAVPYANIINHRTHSGTITNVDGLFSLEMLNIDSLAITSVGFEKSTLKIPRNYSEYDVYTFIMKPVNYAIGEVQVTGEKKSIDLGIGGGKDQNMVAFGLQRVGQAFQRKRVELIVQIGHNQPDDPAFARDHRAGQWVGAIA